ncbi:DHH family phosphoesterase [Spiroplasma floricola]|uniref:Bifunctional oligoribonuclease and PAP phosphatase NrnA n=1 Tax=Spiroplasma floricola 23-6 TaxID=1336749 RepID=A0A2K8SFD1_9MOLU|nr:bifunctional oligoribonuclease/PAP phosphatase NrnA [Spiroplasma floricola]AUB32142.1 bifunctional oligoribonuclease and PAP phosphatase NrnA [Spiroplasma floricola 23-6]
MKIKDNELVLIKKIKEYKNIIISKHVSPDWDTQGSAYGLREIILKNFENKSVYVVGEKLNLGLREEDESKLNKDIISSALLITVDVANFDRVDFEFKNEVKEVFKIDHHLEVDEFTKNKIVDVSAIACTQVITLWANQNNLKITKEAGTYLYYGLITDSGRFLFDKTNGSTFQAAKILVEAGVIITEIYSQLFLKELKLAKWHNKAFSIAKFYNKNQIAFIKVKTKYFKNLDLGEEEIKSALTVLSGIKEVKIWALAYKTIDSDKIKVSIRSREFDINSIAVNYNGGGHKLASGAKLDSWKEIKSLVNDLSSLIE